MLLALLWADPVGRYDSSAHPVFLLFFCAFLGPFVPVALFGLVVSCIMLFKGKPWRETSDRWG